jgi:hypothetical protein
MIVELTTEEAEILRSLVEQRVNELGPEIHHTQSREYRAALQRDRELLGKLLERMVPVVA